MLTILKSLLWQNSSPSHINKSTNKSTISGLDSAKAPDSTQGKGSPRSTTSNIRANILAFFPSPLSATPLLGGLLHGIGAGILKLFKLREQKKDHIQEEINTFKECLANKEEACLKLDSTKNITSDLSSIVNKTETGHNATLAFLLETEKSLLKNLNSRCQTFGVSLEAYLPKEERTVQGSHNQLQEEFASDSNRSTVTASVDGKKCSKLPNSALRFVTVNEQKFLTNLDRLVSLAESIVTNNPELFKDKPEAQNRLFRRLQNLATQGVLGDLEGYVHGKNIPKNSTKATQKGTTKNTTYNFSFSQEKKILTLSAGQYTASQAKNDATLTLGYGADQELNDTLSSIKSTSELNDTLSSIKSTSELNDTLSSIKSTSELNDTLSSIKSTSELTVTITLDQLIQENNLTQKDIVVKNAHYEITAVPF